MVLSVGYGELGTVVVRSSQVELKFSCVSNDTLRVEYPLKVMGMSQGVGIDLRVAGISGNDVDIVYSAGGAMANMAVGVALNRFRDKLAGIADICPGNRITVHLDRVPDISSVLDKMRLTAISFNEDAASLVLEMR